MGRMNSLPDAMPSSSPSSRRRNLLASHTVHVQPTTHAFHTPTSAPLAPLSIRRVTDS